MKKKTGRLIIATLLVCTMVAGCGKKEMAPIDYPDEAKQDTEATVTEETTTAQTAQEAGDVPGRLTYDVHNKKGSVCYSVNAEVCAAHDDLAVVEIERTPISDDHVKNLFSGVFDKDTMHTVFNPQIADMEYISDRIDVLESRRAETGDTKAIQDEIETLQKILDKGDFSSRYTVSIPEEPTPIDLSEYFEATYGESISARACAADGYIGGELYRGEFVEYNNSYIIRFYRPRYYYCRGDEYYLIGKADENESDGDFTAESAQKAAEFVLWKLFPKVYGYSGIYKTNVFGGMDQSHVAHAYDKPGYLFLTGPTAYSIYHPANVYNDMYSDRVSDTGYMSYMDDIQHVKLINDQLLNTMKNSDGSCNEGYESVSVAVDEEGVYEFTFSNLTNTKKLNTMKPEMLSFDEIDTRAQNYLAYKADNNDTDGSTEVIDKIELGMARITSEGHTYMVPAWYYMLKSESDTMLPRPAVCVNAMDGSIIDVARGGITVEF